MNDNKQTDGSNQVGLRATPQWWVAACLTHSLSFHRSPTFHWPHEPLPFNVESESERDEERNHYLIDPFICPHLQMGNYSEPSWQERTIYRSPSPHCACCVCLISSVSSHNFFNSQLFCVKQNHLAWSKCYIVIFFFLFWSKFFMCISW